MSTICRCSVFGCNHNSRNSEVSFFRFPKDPERARLWVVACKRRDLLGKLDRLHNSSYRVCGAHFKREMFASDLRNRLQRLAVPSVFNVRKQITTIASTATATRPVFSGAAIYIIQAPQGVTHAGTEQQPIPGLITYPKALTVSQPTPVQNTNEAAVDPLDLEILGESSSKPADDAMTFIKEEHDFDEENSGPVPLPSPPPLITKRGNPVEVRQISQTAQNLDETTISFIVKEEPPSPSSPEISMPAYINMELPKETRDQEAQTSTDLVMQIPRIINLKRAKKYLENQNFFFKQKIRKLQYSQKNNILANISFEDYKKLTYAFCPSKTVANRVIKSVSLARQKNDM